MNLTAIAQEAYRTARQQGRFQGETTYHGYVAMIHSEMAEALRSYRETGRIHDLHETMGDGKPTGVSTELADVMIRCLTLMTHFELPLEHALRHQLGLTEEGDWRRKLRERAREEPGFGDVPLFEETIELGHRLAAQAGAQAGAAMAALQGGGRETMDEFALRQAALPLADIIIWAMDAARDHGIPLEEAMEAKLAYNRSVTGNQGKRI